MKFWNSQSLWAHLTWRFIFVQLITLSIASALITILIFQIDPNTRVMDDRVPNAIVSSIKRAPDGSLMMHPSEDLKNLRTEFPNFWMLVTDAEGHVYREGRMPKELEPLTANYQLVDTAEMQSSREPYKLSSIIRTANTDIGKLHIFAGRAGLVSAIFANIISSNSFFGILWVMLIIATVIATPLVVRKSMRGLAVAESHARQIDFNKHGTRLPEDKIPNEVKGLVKAVNLGLTRLDEGYERHQRFLADAAHELKTPIAILQARIENLPDDADRTRLLMDVGRLGGLADQLLDLQRLGKSHESFAPVDLVALAQRTTADLAPLAIAAGYTVSLDAAEPEAWIRGDAGAIERLLTNLIQNAITHGGNNGRIEIVIGADGALEVRDTGPGIALEHREKVFEPFYRVRPLDRGAGLGLNLVRDIVKRHDGEISVSDSPQGGACFRIVLPPLVEYA